MSGKSLMKLLAALGAASGLALGAGQANAAVFNLTLSGHSADLSEFQVNCCGSHFDLFSLALSGLDQSTAITVNSGDTINATVEFDAPLSFPASVTGTSYILFLSGTGFPDLDTSTVATTATLFDGATQVAQATTSSTGTHGEFASQINLLPPDNGPITFDRMVNSFTISTPNQAITLDGSGFEAALVSPLGVPEPQAWTLMLAGFAGAGAMVRRWRAAAA